MSRGNCLKRSRFWRATVGEFEQKINKILDVPQKLQVVRECILWLLMKHTDMDSEIEIERTEINSSSGTNKLIFTITICD